MPDIIYRRHETDSFLQVTKKCFAQNHLPLLKAEGKHLPYAVPTDPRQDSTVRFLFVYQGKKITIVFFSTG